MTKKKSATRLRRSFTPEFKRDAVRLVQEGKTLTEVAQNLGMARNLLEYWKRQLEQKSPEAFPGHGNVSGDAAEISRLKKELRDAKEERDILKKRWPTSRTTRSEVPVRPGAPGDLPGRQDVRSPEGLPQWVLCVA